MAKYSVNRNELKESILAVLSENIDAFGMSDDYENDMQNLANTTGETMDDAFLDSVAQYDVRNGVDQAPVYPDRKKEQMNADWHNIDQDAKDTQAKYGYNAQQLDRLNAFTDTVDQYLNDINWNQEENTGEDVLGSEWEKADAERRMNAESIVRQKVRNAIKEMYDSYNHPEQSNGNQFAGNYGTAAHNFTHDGADSYFARKDQDKMNKKEQDAMKRNTKRSMDAADKRPLHRKGSLNRAFDESKNENGQQIQEGFGKRYVLHFYRNGYGADALQIDDLNEIKPIFKQGGITYWDVTTGNNTSEISNLIAWGGKGGYWANMATSQDLRPADIQRILSKKKDIQMPQVSNESKINENDDDAFWKQEQQDELSYDMREFMKAMQKEQGTYHAKSKDGKFQTGDKVIVHGRTQDIQGVIKDFDIHLMTWEETADVDYEKDGRTWTLLGCPLSKIEKVQETAFESQMRGIVREALVEMINEEWYPEEDDTLDDYYFGSIMTLDVDGVFDELSPEVIQRLQSIGPNSNEPYIEMNNKYSSVMVTKVNLTPDGFDGYDISVTVAVSSPDMPHNAIEEEVTDMVWFWIEEQTGVNSPRVYITHEKPVFDRRTKYANQ